MILFRFLHHAANSEMSLEVLPTTYFIQMLTLDKCYAIFSLTFSKSSCEKVEEKHTLFNIVNQKHKTSGTWLKNMTVASQSIFCGILVTPSTSVSIVIRSLWKNEDLWHVTNVCEVI